MMAGSHIALGAAAWLAAAPYLGLPAASPGCLGLAIIGSLLPDIDHPKSWVGKRSWPISTVVSAIFGHRGVTHSLLAVVACVWLATRRDAAPDIAWPLVVGYLSHLGADLLTPGGLRLLWPIKGSWALPLCRAGSPFEPLIVALVLSTAWSSTGDRPDLRQAWQAAVTRASAIIRREEPLPLPPPMPPRHLALR